MADLNISIQYDVILEVQGPISRYLDTLTECCQARQAWSSRGQVPGTQSYLHLLRITVQHSSLASG
jgi:hypothetical protein